MIRSRFARAACGLLLLSVCGCGTGDRPELGEVTGTVTLDGQPLIGVIVMFTPDEGRPATGQTDAFGKYELVYRYGVNGAKIGPNTVSLVWPTGETGPAIPKEYGAESKVKVEVEPGDNVFDYDLKSD